MAHVKNRLCFASCAAEQDTEGEWSGALPQPSSAEQAGRARNEGCTQGCGMDTLLSPSGVPHLPWLLFLHLQMLKPGLRNNATASGEHLPQRSKGKTSINQQVSTYVPVHKGAGIRLWSLCNCCMCKEIGEINRWDEILKALLETI